MPDPILKVHPDDNVIVALDDLKPGQQFEINKSTIQLREDIPLKHKFSLDDLKEGDPVIMYGVLIGRAIKDIAQGAKISTENTAADLSEYTLGERQTSWNPPDVSKWKDKTFMGYHRADGQVGTMNYWLVIPLVFCENRNVNVIREALLEELGYPTERSWSVNTRQLIQRYQNGLSVDALLEEDIIGRMSFI